MMKIVIMAGGKGTRIASVNSDVPKPMIPILGKPILEHQIEALSRQGFKDFVLVIGYKGNVISDYFGDGTGWNVKIEYVTEESPLGTAGSFYYLKEMINEDFLLVNGDIIFDIDVGKFYEAHRKNCMKGGLVTLFTHPNDHPYDSGIIKADCDSRVTDWLHKEDERLWYKNRVNAGIHMLSPEILKMVTEPVKTDMDRDILKPLIPEGKLYAYDSPEYVKDMGTPERFYSTEKDLRDGVVASKNLSHTQKAVFLDRDGTVNRYVGFLRNIEDFQLIEGVSDAIKLFHNKGYLVIVVTNQPVIARGEVTFEELDEIHNKMETLLGQDGTYVDDIFYCPHHPDKGFEGERPEYKTDCDCRKPKPGMLLTAADKYNIDLSRSYMIGDGDSDVMAGEAAGCRTFKVSEDMSLSDIANEYFGDWIKDDELYR